MTISYADRVKETTTTMGTGTVNLGAPGRRAAVGAADQYSVGGRH
jgi:hypothetical protein